MMSTRNIDSQTATALLVLEPPRHCGLSPIVLVPGRHVIGAHSTCAIRLNAAGIAEQHAMVLAGEHRTVLKAIDPRTWVNEGPVSDVVLRAGDRLSIGPLTFRARAATREERALAATIPAPADVPLLAQAPTMRREMVPPPMPLSERFAPATEAVPFVPASPAATFEPVATQLEVPTHLHEPTVASERTATPVAVTAAESVSASTSVTVEAPEPLDDSSLPSAEVHPPLNNSLDVATAELDMPTPGAPTPEPLETRPITRDEDPLGWRLEEIHHRLVELRQTTDLITRPSPRPERQDTDLRHPLEQLQLRHAELKKRSEQVAAETQALQERARVLAEKEARIAAHQQQLRDEANRIATVAQAARQSLAEEHAQHVATWQEWEASYQRMTRDLAENLDAIERQREILQSEAARLGTLREELDRTREDQERQRQSIAADQAAMVRESADLATLRDELEQLRRQQRHEADDLAENLAHERQNLEQLRTELLNEQQELARERQALIADWSSHARRIESDNQRRTALLAQQAEDRDRLAAERAELTALAARLAREQADLQQRELQRDAAVQRAELAMREAESWRSRLASTEEELVELRAQRDRDRVLAAEQREEDLRFRQEMQARYDEDRRQLDIERQHLESLRELLAAAAPTPANVTPTEAAPVEPELADHEEAASVTEAVPQETLAASDTATDPAVPVPPPLPQSAEPVADTWQPTGISVDPTLTWSVTSFSAPPMESRGPAAPPPLPLPAATLDSSTHFGLGEHPSSSTAWPTMTPEPALWGAAAELRPADSETPPPGDTPGSDPWSVAWPSQAGVPDSSPNIEPIEPQPEVLVAEPSVTEIAPARVVDETPDPSLVVTLAEVNREFGIPTEPESPAVPALPSWWVDSPTAPAGPPVAADQPGWVLDALRAAPAPTAESSDSPEQLRSELARLFDLPAGGAPANPDLVTPSDDTPRSPDAETLNDQSSHVSEPPVSTATSAADSDAEPRSETSDESVDVYLARLLARSRGEDEPAPTVPVSSAPAPAAAAPSVTSATAVADRSHLLAEPKHKQDKQAVRENLQSFREVAHLSARSALARHSLEQLRNATIAKGILLGCSALATIAFGTEPLWNGQIQVWKAFACSLATLLSAIEFRRSWNQLFRPLGRLNSASATPEAELVEESSSATAALPEAPGDVQSTTSEEPAPAAPESSDAVSVVASEAE